MKGWFGLLAFLVLCYGAAALGSLGTFEGQREWYPTLEKPSFNPPDWVFGPVWTVLYGAMAVAAWLVVRSGRPLAVPMSLFAVQLVLNVAWSWLFFYFRSPGAAFAEILVFWLVLLATTVVFFRASKVAGWLFVPYLAWVTFAAILNGAIWRLNS